MAQDHLMELTVGANGALDVKVHYRGDVPNLLARFSEDIQRRAASRLWWSTRYERQLKKIARSLPSWAKETIRQHILQERAFRIQRRMQRAAERQRVRGERRAVRAKVFQRISSLSQKFVRPPKLWQGAASWKLTAVQQELVAGAIRGAVRGPDLNSELRQAMSTMTTSLRSPSLAERFAKETSALKAVPLPDQNRERSR